MSRNEKLFAVWRSDYISAHFALVHLKCQYFAASGINCYQCVSTSHDDPFQCNEFLGSDVDLVPKSCDAVFGAQYCIKHTGRFEGLKNNL